MILLLGVSSYFLTKIIIIPFVNFLKENGAVQENYSGNKIPIGMGLVLWIGFLPTLLVYEILYPSQKLSIFLFLLTVVLIAGQLDDFLGNHDVKGFKGHIKLLFTEKRLTSGNLKALIISCVSFYTAIKLSENLFDLLLNFFILILTTNFFNLLDVRPGRTIKVFLLAVIILFFIQSESRILLTVLFSSVLAYAVWDIKGKVMLGDIGANLLGISIGWTLLDVSLIVKLIIFIFLVLIHIYSENKSINKYIEKSMFLKLIDDFGR